MVLQILSPWMISGSRVVRKGSMNMASPSPSSPSSHQAPANHYDVFISFRGEETSRTFVRRLVAALSSRRISTFFDDEISAKVNISSSILRAIDGSTISVIIFSEDYAGSKWCLMELGKILECQRSNGQIVIPVFYGVDPSDVRNQTGKFGAAHARLKDRLREEETMDLDKIGFNLKEAGSIAGWQSSLRSHSSPSFFLCSVVCLKNTVVGSKLFPLSVLAARDKSGLIGSIVVHIKNKLDQVRLRLNHPASLVGIASHVERIETLLCLDSPDLRVVGIYGPGGVGKTTIAKAVMEHISARCDVSYFDSNKVSPAGIVSQIVVGKRLHKKILVVLDDFGKLDLVDTLGSLSGVSKILVISRDAQMLQSLADETYEVEGLNRDDARQLFSLNAFNRNNEPTENQIRLSESVSEVALGNPLALVVLGCALFGMSAEEEEEWLHVFNRIKDKPNYSDVQSSLRKEPIYDVQDVLRISYDTLNDNEKKIFLEIARYLIGRDLKDVLRCFGNGVVPIVHKLVDKSLITISSNKIEMHDLLREMAYSLIDDGNRRRVYRWSPEVVLKYVFPLSNLSLASVLVIIGSAQKLLDSLIALIVALSFMMVFLGELVYRGRHRNISLKWNGMRWKIKKQVLDSRPFFTWFDVFSLLCAIGQLVSTTVGYIYSLQHKENPIKVSLLVSLSYIIGMVGSQIVSNYQLTTSQ